MAADGLGRGLHPDRGQAGVRHPAERLAADDRRDPDHAGGRLAQRLAHTGHTEHGADRNHRIGGSEQDGVRTGDRVQDARGRLGLVGADREDRVRGRLGAVAHPPLLEVHCLALLRLLWIVDHDVGFHAVVRHRQQAHAGLPAVAQGLGHRRERVAGAQHPGPDEVGGDVLVAKAEPGGLGAVGGELLLDGPGLVRVAPAALGVDAAAQRVHAGVEVRADAQAVHPDVVAGVHQRGHLVRRVWAVARRADRRQPQRGLDTKQEPGPAHSTDHNHDLHDVGSSHEADRGTQYRYRWCGVQPRPV